MSQTSETMSATYRHAFVQTRPLPNLAAFVACYGREPEADRVEFGLRALGRLGPDNVYEPMHSKKFDHAAPEFAPSYEISGFQTSTPQESQAALAAAQKDAAETVARFYPIGHRKGVHMQTQPNQRKIAHSEQFPVRLQLDALGGDDNAPVMRAPLLPNIVGEPIVLYHIPTVPRDRREREDEPMPDYAGLEYSAPNSGILEFFRYLVPITRPAPVVLATPVPSVPTPAPSSEAETFSEAEIPATQPAKPSPASFTTPCASPALQPLDESTLTVVTPEGGPRFTRDRPRFPKRAAAKSCTPDRSQTPATSRHTPCTPDSNCEPTGGQAPVPNYTPAAELTPVASRTATRSCTPASAPRKRARANTPLSTTAPSQHGPSRQVPSKQPERQPPPPLGDLSAAVGKLAVAKPARGEAARKPLTTALGNPTPQTPTGGNATRPLKRGPPASYSDEREMNNAKRAKKYHVSPEREPEPQKPTVAQSSTLAKKPELNNLAAAQMKTLENKLPAKSQKQGQAAPQTQIGAIGKQRGVVMKDLPLRKARPLRQAFQPYTPPHRR